MRPSTYLNHLVAKVKSAFNNLMTGISKDMDDTQARDTRNQTVVGLIADTHGLLRPEVLGALSGVDLIVHAGDVGREDILATLGQIAPVYAVRGNIDRGAWAEALLLSRQIDVGQVGLYVYHGHETPGTDLAEAGCQVVVSGHSHKAKAETREGILCLNPGSAGPRRFKLPVTLMRLYVENQNVRHELVKLV